MTAYLFPGQGSQQRGMGKGLFEAFPRFTEEADTILGYSISTLCLEDPQQQLSQTQYTQPALYVVNALSYQRKLQETGKQPEFVAGHSLGEYNALQASGALSFADGLKLVQKRGELMSQATGGAMAAILELTADKIAELLRTNNLDGIDIANANGPKQTVISGPEADLTNAQPIFEAAGGPFIPLNTSGAFHSRYMEAAKTAFTDYLKHEDFDFADLQIPVIANVTAMPYAKDQIVDHLSAQITGTVQWVRSVEYLLAQGETQFEELGVGDVLTKLVDNIKKNTSIQIGSARQNDTAENSTSGDNATTIEVGARHAVPLQDSATTTEVGARHAVTLQDNATDTTATATEAPVQATANEPTPDTSADTTAETCEPPIKTPQEIIDGLGLPPGSLDEATESAYAERIAAVQKRIADWNEAHPVGTRVAVKDYDEPMETRTRAMLLFGHRAAIYLKGFNGYFHLDDVTCEEDA